MVSHHFVSQLVLFALIWLFVVLHLTWLKRSVTAPATPTEPEPLTPKRHRSNEPKLLLDSRVVNLPMAYNPFFVLLSSMKPLFFNSLTLIGSKYSVNPCPTSEAKAFPSKSCSSGR